MELKTECVNAKNFIAWSRGYKHVQQFPIVMR